MACQQWMSACTTSSEFSGDPCTFQGAPSNVDQLPDLIRAFEASGQDEADPLVTEKAILACASTNQADWQWHIGRLQVKRAAANDERVVRNASV